MKRTKKMLVGLLVALSVFCSSFGLSACVLGNIGGNQNSSSKDSSSISSEEESSSQGGGNNDDSSSGGSSGSGSGGNGGNDGTLEDDPISDYDDIISDGDLRG